MRKLSVLVLVTGLALSSCKTSDDSSFEVKESKDSNGYSYETVSNDPTGLRLYTLDNGLKVYLSKNADEPKIQTFIAVRAGSNYDPAESTGLAHYLEHMVFKGTSKMGTLDWEKEKVHLDEISSLYEQRKNETDPAKKKELYKKIDEESFKASQFSIANEYDKLTSSMGATGTNAHTWFEETVYKNKIPANELDKWLALESERFSELVLRLFHTELEVVFEEFNRGQDNDFRKSYAAMLDGLFPKHPYGQQNTIGTAEHLKNPSMVAIHNYFDTYYVPNNMAMVLVGDLDFEKTIKMVDAHFGLLESKEVVHPVLPTEDPITSPVVKEVFGPTAASVSIAYRANGIGSEDQKLLTMADMLLANGNAGLIDLNLNQKQEVQRASCSTTFLNDYGYHNFSGSPKQGQTLDEVKDLLFEQIEKLKKGDFDEWMLAAVINDMKLSKTRQNENSSALATAYYNAFIHHENWSSKISFIDELKKVTKQDIMDFANRFYANNYVVTYKRKGVDNNIAKVANPGITPVELNRGKKSVFNTEFSKLTSDKLAPVFIDYNEKIKTSTLKNGLTLSYIINKNNDLFDLNIIFDMGKDNIKQLELAVGYLDYVGTNDMSVEALKKEFYKLGINYGVRTGSDQSMVYLSGLKENLKPGLALLENLWNNAVADQESYDKYVAKILKGRSNAKSQKGNILFNGLLNYGIYGENSELRNIYNAADLKAMDPVKLIALVKDLKNYKQRIFYYGKDVAAATASIEEFHKVNETLKDYPAPVVYTQQETGGKVYFVDFDMVQSEILFIAKADVFDKKQMALTSLFNTYFGRGLSSIVFQEIRESKSLAYSAFASYSSARKKGESNTIMAYVGTQANKLPQAVDAMLELMRNMPEAQEQFKAAKKATLKKIASERITKSTIFWKFEGLKKRGITYDIRKDIYEEVQNITMKDLAAFFVENIKEKKYTSLVIGNKKDMKMKELLKLGEFKELDVNYLFNYQLETVKQ
ncbi:MAG: peptidase M16 [Flavobacteriaceae bacterium]|nr:MAG: peptidase M16 [Flavobacteriaceae bacterium]